MPMNFIKAEVQEPDKGFYNLALSEQLNRVLSLKNLTYKDFYQGGKITFDGSIFKYIASNSSEVRDCLISVNTRLRETDGFKDLPWSGPLTPLEWMGWFLMTSDATGANKPISDEFRVAFVALLIQKLEENNLIEKDILKQSNIQRWVESLFSSYKRVFDPVNTRIFLVKALSECLYGSILSELNEKISALKHLEKTERIEVLAAFISKIRDSDPEARERVVSNRPYTKYFFSKQLLEVGAILWSNNTSEDLTPLEAAKKIDQLYFPDMRREKTESVKEERREPLLFSDGATSEVDNDTIDRFVEIIKDALQHAVVVEKTLNPITLIKSIKSSQDNILLALDLTQNILTKVSENEKKEVIARLVKKPRVNYNKSNFLTRQGISTTVNNSGMNPSLIAIFKMIFSEPLDFTTSKGVDKFMLELTNVSNNLRKSMEEEAVARPQNGGRALH